MAFGRWIGEKESAEVLDAALDAGFNLIDTADVYGRGMDLGNPLLTGESEEILGKLVQGKRSEIVLATKVNGRVGNGVNDAGLSRYHIIRAVETSLRRLRTDHIDLYQVHRFDPQTPLEETLRALDDLVHQGKVRYIGASNFAAWQLAKAHGVSERLGLHRLESIQPEYSIISRQIEQELLPFAESESVGVIVYSPLGRGLLTGKYRQGEAPPQGSRGAAGEQRLLTLLEQERHYQIVEELKPLAEERGWTLPQMALAWVLNNPIVTSAILGASRASHVTEAIRALDRPLSPVEIQEIDRITRQAGTRQLTN